MDTNANSVSDWDRGWSAGWGAEQQHFENTSDAAPVAGGGIKQENEESPFVPERGFYQPSTEETWEAYQALISIVEAQSRRNLPGVVMCGTADEVLAVLKSKNIINPWDKKREIEKILNPIPYFLFNEMVSTANLITDYYVVTRASNTDDRVEMFVPEKDFYQPKSEETSTGYKLLLDLVSNQFGCQQPQIVQCVLAHEVLFTLKDASLENSKKREMIEYTLNKITDEIFDLLLFIADLITDFNEGSTGPNAFGAPTHVPRSEYIDQNPIQWSPPVIPGFDFECGRQQEVGSVSAAGLYNITDDGDDLNKSSLDILCQYSSGDDEPGSATADVNVFTSTKLVYSDDEEADSAPGDATLLTGAKRVHSSDADPVNPTADDDVSPAGRKRFCSSEDGPLNPEADVNATSSRTKLEYSSEEEIMYFDYDKAREPDKEEEDDWVKIDYDEDGI